MPAPGPTLLRPNASTSPQTVMAMQCHLPLEMAVTLRMASVRICLSCVLSPGVSSVRVHLLCARGVGTVQQARSARAPLPGLQLERVEGLQLARVVDDERVVRVEEVQRVQVGLAQLAELAAGGAQRRGVINYCRAHQCGQLARNRFAAMRAHLPHVKRLPSEESAIECCAPAAAATTR